MKKYKRRPRKQPCYIKFIRYTSGQAYTAPYYKGKITVLSISSFYGQWTTDKAKAETFESKATALTVIDEMKLHIHQRHDIGIISIKTGKEI